MTKEELQKIISIDEGFRIELTTSTGNMDTQVCPKLSQVCPKLEIDK